MTYQDKEYIEESRAEELFKEEFNSKYTAIDVLLGCFDNYSVLFNEWLEDNNYHCQEQEQDKYGNGDYE